MAVLHFDFHYAAEGVDKFAPKVAVARVACIRRQVCHAEKDGVRQYIGERCGAVVFGRLSGAWQLAGTSSEMSHFRYVLQRSQIDNSWIPTLREPFWKPEKLWMPAHWPS